MALKQKKTPYELLVRWNDAGVLVGAHVVYRESAVNNGVEISSKIGDALPLSVAGGIGFPLADILSAMHVDALIVAEEKTKEVTALASEKDKAVRECEAAMARVEQLTAKLLVDEKA